MNYGGMVHALEEIRRLLKPTGTLIDIHPVAEPSPVEIRHGGAIDVAGHLSVQSWCIDYEQADQALSEIVRRGLFAVERQSVFESRTHYGSADEMRTSLKEALDKYARDGESPGTEVPQVEALAARAGGLMQAAGTGAELMVLERTHISRLRPT
jgi:hypothetical protein